MSVLLPLCNWDLCPELEDHRINTGRCLIVPCRTCMVGSRETVGMVCQSCGTDYALQAPDLSATEAAIVARFDAAPNLPELDAGRVDDLAYDLACDLACARWYDLDDATREKWRDVARHALTVPGIAP